MTAARHSQPARQRASQPASCSCRCGQPAQRETQRPSAQAQPQPLHPLAAPKRTFPPPPAATPAGGWLQVASSAMPLGSLIVGVDLVPIKPIRGAKTFVEDITSAKCRQLIKRECAGQLIDCVVHDGAPNVGGAWANEAYTQVGAGAGAGVWVRVGGVVAAAGSAAQGMRGSWAAGQPGGRRHPPAPP